MVESHPDVIRDDSSDDLQRLVRIEVGLGGITDESALVHGPFVLFVP